MSDDLVEILHDLASCLYNRQGEMSWGEYQDITNRIGLLRDSAKEDFPNA